MTIPQLCLYFDIKCEHVLRREVGKENLEKARVKAVSALANKAFSLALAGDRVMLIFLLKTQARWTESSTELELKLEYEKQLLDYKQKIGYVEQMSAPVEIYLTDGHSPERDRNYIEIDQGKINDSILGLPDTK